MSDEEISRLIENAIEIADDNLVTLQEHFGKIMGRHGVLMNYIVPWALEAENEWKKAQKHDEDRDYYEFIDCYTSKKMEELLCKKNYGIEKS